MMLQPELITNEIFVPDLPAVEGLIFRHYRGEQDLPAMVEIANRCNRADHVTDVEGIETVHALLETIKLFVKDASRELVIAQVDEEMVAWGRVWTRREDDGNRYFPMMGYVAPEWRRKGIGGALVNHQERVLRSMAQENADDAPRFFKTGTWESRIGKVELFERKGYRAARHFYDMRRPDLENLPALEPPSGFELRTVQPEHYRAIYDAMDEAFRDHWGHFPPTEAHYRMWLEHPNFDPGLWQIAWDDDQIAGVAINIIDHESNAQIGQLLAYVDELAVRRAWRRRGLGRALLVASLHAFKARGMNEVGLGVDAENWSGALKLYESVGFQRGRTHIVFQKAF